VKKLIILTVLVIGTLMIPFTTVFAAGASTSITGPSSIKQGDTITLSYFVDGNGNTITSAYADLNYNKDDLQFISFKAATIPNWDITYYSDSKIVFVGAGMLNEDPISDRKLIGTLTFKVLAEPGKTVTVFTANLNFWSYVGPLVATTGSWSALVVSPPPATYGITVLNDGNGKASANVSTASSGTTITLSATPNSGYVFSSWQVVSGGVSIGDNKFTMPSNAVTVKAIFEKINIPTEPDSYSINVNSGKSNKTSAKSGDKITLTANEILGKVFDKWTTSDGVKFANASAMSTTFIMPSKNVTITATYTDAPISAPPSSSLSDLTVNGFDLFPEFDPNDSDMTDFVLILPDDVTEIDVSAFPTCDGCTVEIIGEKGLTPGINIVQIRVIDEAGLVTEYTIAAMVGGENAHLTTNAGKSPCWWWLLIVMMLLGLTTGYYTDKYVLKNTK